MWTMDITLYRYEFKWNHIRENNNDDALIIPSMVFDTAFKSRRQPRRNDKLNNYSDGGWASKSRSRSQASDGKRVQVCMMMSVCILLRISQCSEHVAKQKWYYTVPPGHGRRKRGGGRGDASPSVEKSAGDGPPEIMIFRYLFPWHICKFCIFQHFQNKVAEIRGETTFWG